MPILNRIGTIFYAINNVLNRQTTTYNRYVDKCLESWNNSHIMNNKPKKLKQVLSAIRLTDAQIGEYQELYLQMFGKPISKDEALVQSLALVRLVKTISQVDDYEKVKNDDN